MIQRDTTLACGMRQTNNFLHTTIENNQHTVRAGGRPQLITKPNM
jgi:hypothetical protein